MQKFLFISLLIASISYNSIGQDTFIHLDSIIAFAYKSDSDSALSKKTIVKYDKNGLRQDSLNYAYDYGVDQWSYIWIDFDRFDEDRNLIETGSLRIYPDSTKNGYLRYIYEYDDLNHRTKLILYTWSDADSDWIPYASDDYYLNLEGQPDSASTYIYNANDDTWINDGYRIYTYTENKRLESSVTYFKEDSEFVRYIKHLYEYVNGKRKSYSTNKWNIEEEKWVNENNREYAYNEEGDLIFSEYRKWNVNNDEYDIIEKQEWEYDASGRVLSNYKYDWPEEINDYRCTYKGDYAYFPMDSYTLFTEERLDRNTGELYKYKQIKTLYDSGNLNYLNIISSYDEGQSEWIVSTKEYKYYSYQQNQEEILCFRDTLQWNGTEITEPGDYQVKCTATDGRDSMVYLSVSMLTNSSECSISGDLEANEFSVHRYSVPSVQNVSYQWSTTKGKITSERDSSEVEVLWGYDGSGTISCYNIDLDGCKSEKSTLNINILDTHVDHHSLNGLALYPNPAVEELFIRFEQESDRYTLKIYNEIGQLQHCSELVKGIVHRIDISDLKSGVYTLQLLQDNTECHYQRFIKK